jgi:hypothetical protein
MALPKRLEQKPAGMNMSLDNERRRLVETYNALPETAQARRGELYQHIKSIDSSIDPKKRAASPRGSLSRGAGPRAGSDPLTHAVFDGNADGNAAELC